jgi:hypothetical protein
LSGFANQKDPRIDEAQFLLALLALARIANVSDRAAVDHAGCAYAFRLD